MRKQEKTKWLTADLPLAKMLLKDHTDDKKTTTTKRKTKQKLTAKVVQTLEFSFLQ